MSHASGDRRLPHVDTHGNNSCSYSFSRFGYVLVAKYNALLQDHPREQGDFPLVTPSEESIRIITYASACFFAHVDLAGPQPSHYPGPHLVHPSDIGQDGGRSSRGDGVDRQPD